MPEDTEKCLQTSERKKVGVKHFYTQQRGLSNVQPVGRHSKTRIPEIEHTWVFLKRVSSSEFQSHCWMVENIVNIVAYEPSINIALKVWFIKHVFCFMFAFHLSHLKELTTGLKSKKRRWKKMKYFISGKDHFSLFLIFL